MRASFRRFGRVLPPIVRAASRADADTAATYQPQSSPLRAGGVPGLWAGTSSKQPMLKSRVS
jgi:hypothetical protein